ncbi:MaoC family dehydratase N-terminal domain-containing protein [Bacillus thermotolerans]|uniref:MaoC family dehydratase N-terminal domain-containing protein n=1 Tax=Bacillus thermotolerans TaxID=1221996 RepID=UPI00057EE79A|nr:MaoC family dehydratase N-terminal domain-containing protein [Bacillus thermotolerans]KKB35194.1 hypothetical protein QY97_01935 [Bacillus thermotolerans]
MTVIDRTVIGSKSETLEFEVEKGAIRAFAHALGSDNPIYFDEDYAKQQGYASLVAPPTFPSTFRVPKPGINVELSRTLHGAQEFIYERPIVAGDTLRCTNYLADIFEKEGKSGTMTFFILETRGEDLSGNLVYRSKTTIIYR